MIILAVDPGKRAGWATYRDGRYSRSGTFSRGDDVLAIADFLDGIHFRTMVIEGQYLPRGRAKGIITLIRRRCIWEILAIERRREVVVVAPATWQSRYRKIDHIIAARTIAGRDLTSRDEAAAICIGDWYISTLDTMPITRATICYDEKEKNRQARTAEKINTRIDGDNCKNRALRKYPEKCR